MRKQIQHHAIQCCVYLGCQIDIQQVWIRYFGRSLKHIQLQLQSRDGFGIGYCGSIGLVRVFQEGISTAQHLCILEVWDWVWIISIGRVPTNEHTTIKSSMNMYNVSDKLVASATPGVNIDNKTGVEAGAGYASRTALTLDSVHDLANFTLSTSKLVSAVPFHSFTAELLCRRDTFLISPDFSN